jgi:hypothetical protein
LRTGMLCYVFIVFAMYVGGFVSVYRFDVCI